MRQRFACAALIGGALVMTPAATQPGPPRLHADGRALVTSTGNRFEWRGVTAFRAIDHLADGDAATTREYLDWAKRSGFTLVRVLTRISDWAVLSAADGRRYLPDLLALAAERGMYVEAVATVNSGSSPYDWRAHARAVAEICSKATNCLYEFANEPGHPTQADELHDMSVVDRATTAAVAGLPGLPWTAGPSWTSDTAPHPGGRYLVRHLDRTGEPLAQIARLRDLAALSSATGKFVVSDEPTGADEEDGARTGRQRWNRPEWFFAMGALCRGFSLGCTFHLQDGLATTVPRPVQQSCARAFIEGWHAMPDDMTVAQGPGASPVAGHGANVVAAYAFLDRSARAGVAVVLHRSETLAPDAMTLGAGWSLAGTVAARPGVTIARVRRAG